MDRYIVIVDTHTNEPRLYAKNKLIGGYDVLIFKSAKEAYDSVMNSQRYFYGHKIVKL